MTIKDQMRKIRENWLIAALLLVLVVFSLGGNIFSTISSVRMSYGGVAEDMAYGEPAYQKSMAYGIRSSMPYYPTPIDSDFAPEAEERKITKSASMSSEVERKEFSDAESKLKSIVKSSNSYLLNENVNEYGTGLDRYKYGSYSIKVESEKYEAVITQLKDIGEVKSFYENANDITGQYTNLEDEIKFEKDKLKRYQDMLAQATLTEDKINLADRIANQERTIKYFEDSLKNADNQVSYSTISFSMTEKQSGYQNIGFVKFSELVRNLVESLNGLFSLIFVLLPWALAAIIIRIVWKIFRKKQKK